MYRISNKNSLNRITFKHLVFHCRKEVLRTDKPAICDMTPTLTKNIVIRQEYSNQHKQRFADYLFHVAFVSLAPVQILIGVCQSRKYKSGLGEL